MDLCCSLYSHGRAVFPVWIVREVKLQEVMTYEKGSIDDAATEPVKHIGALSITFTGEKPFSRAAGEGTCKPIASPILTSQVRPVMVLIQRYNCDFASTERPQYGMYSRSRSGENAVLKQLS
ncbi:hypothetical protein E8E13_004116 [Curvularia kusanoi]|uniref:Uncharacterized protein n=1 Tax=Curvularia kusanoi TaxID=90978 RepID=A0A9P4W7H1_CURKU|nr:hypothetical protein E8E13_004116 [Curvularia kusanoi]